MLDTTTRGRIIFTHYFSFMKALVMKHMYYELATRNEIETLFHLSEAGRSSVNIFLKRNGERRSIFESTGTSFARIISTTKKASLIFLDYYN